MATGMFGADVEQLMEFSNTFEMRRETVDHAKSVIGPAIEGVQWFGQDAETYKSSYGQSIPKALGTLSSVLVSRHEDLRRQAEDQDETSRSKSDEGCLKKTGDFFKGLGEAVLGFLKGLIVDGLIGDIADLLGLIGMDFEDGFSWNLDNAKEAWGDMLGGLGALIGRDPETGEWSWATAGEAWKSVGKDLLAWDKWAENPAEAFGQVVWNIGSIFIPGVGVAKIAKTLGKVDVPDASRVDVDNPNRRGDDDGASNKDSDSSSERKPRDNYGGPPERLPDSVSMLPDGTIRTPVGDFPIDKQINNVERGAPDANRKLDPNKPDFFEPNTVYTTKKGEVYVTNEHGQVEYASVTRTLDETVKNPSRKGMDEIENYWNKDTGDVQGHHNPLFMDATNDNINLDPQSKGANGAVDRRVNSPTAESSQYLIERRTHDYMKANEEAPVTWERRTHYDYSGTPETNPNWGHATDYDIRVSTPGENGATSIVDVNKLGTTPVMTPNEDGWINVRD